MCSTRWQVPLPIWLYVHYQDRARGLTKHVTRNVNFWLKRSSVGNITALAGVSDLHLQLTWQKKLLWNASKNRSILGKKEDCFVEQSIALSSYTYANKREETGDWQIVITSLLPLVQNNNTLSEFLKQKTPNMWAGAVSGRGRVGIPDRAVITLNVLPFRILWPKRDRWCHLVRNVYRSVV